LRLQWDLVCDREYLKDLSQTILVIGVIFGAMLFTSLSDHLGRKPVFLFTQWALVVVGVANAFVPNYNAFLVLRFCTGALQQVPQHRLMYVITTRCESINHYRRPHFILNMIKAHVNSIKIFENWIKRSQCGSNNYP